MNDRTHTFLVNAHESFRMGFTHTPIEQLLAGGFSVHLTPVTISSEKGQVKAGVDNFYTTKTGDENRISASGVGPSPADALANALEGCLSHE